MDNDNNVNEGDGDNNNINEGDGDDNNNIIIRQHVDNMSSGAVVTVAVAVTVVDVEDEVDDDDDHDDNNNNNIPTVRKRLEMPPTSPASPLALPLPSSSLESLFEEQRPHISDVDDDNGNDDDIDDDQRGRPDGHDDRPFLERNVVVDDSENGGEIENGDVDDDEIENGDVDDDDVRVGDDGDDDSDDYDLASLFTEDGEYEDALSGTKKFIQL